MGQDLTKFTHARFGEQEVSVDKVITFSDGVPGFEGYKTYALFMDPNSDPFQWLLSTENPKLGFVMINPLVISPDYEPLISRNDLKSLNVASEDDVALWVFVTLADDPKDVTVNLSGPILVNMDTRSARKLALLDDRYSTKHKIFVEAVEV